MADITYYFNSKSTSNWTDSGYMIDNILTNYAYTSSDGTTETLNGNTCPGSDLGTITKVEIRAYGYGDVDDLLQLMPVFGGGDGDVHGAAPGISPVWSSYYDITNDTNAPDWSSWSHIQNLDVKVTFTKVAKGNTMHCAKVEVRVTYCVIPTVTTQACDQVATTSARGNGNITDTGGANCTRRGFCYKEGTEGDPTTSDDVAYDDGDFESGAYTKTIPSLTQGTNYRVRAYAVNPAGTSYGITVQLTTLAVGAPTSFVSPSQTETSIDLSWTKGANADKTLIRFRDDQYPTGISDGYEAYFDTGESVTVGGYSIIQEVEGKTDFLASGLCIRLAEKVFDFPVSNISRVSFLLSKYGSPTGTAYIRIRRDSDDAILATIAEIDVATEITDTKTWYDFDCDVDNPTEQNLMFSVEYEGGGGSDFIRVYYTNTDVLADAVHFHYLTVWIIDNDEDFAIKIYYGTPFFLEPATTYYFRAWGYETSTGLYSETTADLTQATSGGAPPEGVPQQAMHLMRMRRA